MGCRSDGYPEPDLGQQLTDTERMLCACLQFIELTGKYSELLGMSRQYWLDHDLGSSCFKLSSWWEQHKLEDEARKQSEKEAAELQQIRKIAISKLTSLEKQVLGID